jgi:hypothetical protein
MTAASLPIIIHPPPQCTLCHSSPPSVLAMLLVHLQVPPGHIWLQGDNLTMSRDSREYGPVPLAMLKGRVMLQVGGVKGGTCMIDYPFASVHVCHPRLPYLDGHPSLIAAIKHLQHLATDRLFKNAAHAASYPCPHLCVLCLLLLLAPPHDDRHAGMATY